VVAYCRRTGLYAGRQSITTQGRHGGGGDEDNLSDCCCGLSIDMALTCSWVFNSPAMYWPSPSGNDTDDTTSATKPGYRNRLHHTHTQNMITTTSLTSEQFHGNYYASIQLNLFTKHCNNSLLLLGDEETFQATRINLNC